MLGNPFEVIREQCNFQIFKYTKCKPDKEYMHTGTYTPLHRQKGLKKKKKVNAQRCLNELMTEHVSSLQKTMKSSKEIKVFPFKRTWWDKMNLCARVGH